METFRLIDASGDFLIDGDGNYLVWSVGVGAPGSMSLALSAPTIAITTGGPTITLTLSED